MDRRPLAPTRPVPDLLGELRRRLFWILGIWLASALVAFAFKERVFEILTAPAIGALRAAGRTLAVLAPAELFVSYVRASLLGGFLVSLPVTLYQIFAFVAPGLYTSERRIALAFVLAASVLFGIGCLFGYVLVFPLVFEFFLELESSYVTSQWTTDRVLGFVTGLYLGFGLAFQLPVVLLLLTGAGLVRVEQLARGRRYAILAMFVAAGVLTPSPDVISQLALALALIVLYEIGLAAARLWQRPAAGPIDAQAQL